MQTICPHCQTVFKVSDEHLKVADGYVRCGICKEVFNALEKDQPETKKELAANKTVTPAAETGSAKNTVSSAAPLSRPAQEQVTKQPVSTKTPDQPVAAQNLADSAKIAPVPKTETTASSNSTQADLFAAPADKIKPEPSSTPIAAKTTGPETAPATDAKTTEIKSSAGENVTKTAKQTEPEKVTNKDTPKKPSAAAAPAKSTNAVSNTAVTKNISNDSNEAEDDSLFDGVQSKLIPDEYRIPELHNTYSIWHDLAWSLAILVLTASLFAEYTWFNRNELISNPQLRPLVTQICVIVNCNAMELRKPGEIEMTTRNIYSHPNVRNALMISGTLVNHADFEQPYPNILIDFSDVRGEVIASRTFTPEEYLQIKATSLRPLPPRIPINFNMEIQDPGKNAMTYEFSFL